MKKRKDVMHKVLLVCCLIGIAAWILSNWIEVVEKQYPIISHGPEKVVNQSTNF